MISTSLGYIGFDDSNMSHGYGDFDGKTCVITIGAEIASSRGILCVAAAGNEGDKDFPYVGGPGDGKNVLTVGGVKSDGSRTAFSSIGPTYDGRIKPDVMSFAYAVTVASPNGGFYQGNGTSFATPSLAGVLACYWQARRDVPESKIREIIKQSSNNFSLLKPSTPQLYI
jgi:subtilisin family serine protease